VTILQAAVDLLGWIKTFLAVTVDAEGKPLSSHMGWILHGVFQSVPCSYGRVCDPPLWATSWRARLTWEVLPN